MSEIMSQIGQFFSSTGGKEALTGATAGTGLLQNWLANREATKKQKFVEDLITNPAKFQSFVAGFEKPLASGLTADVARSADAYGAERGLGSSPAIMKDVYAQALAPYIQQQKDAATQAALNSLGIYEQSPTTKPMDISSILKMLAMSRGGAPSPISDSFIEQAPPSQVPAGAIPLAPAQPLPTPTISGGGFDPTTMENYG